jgi:DNA adenine methylase
MTTFPKRIEHVKAPPIKSQGIKTKLVPFISENIEWSGKGKWIEPFMGSGCVVFNLQPQKALISDTNHHLINIYKRIQSKDITPLKLKDFLEKEGAILQDKGEEYYYEVRTRFNEYGSPYDFLFLNRSCFNGVIRFNSKGKFNVPFCKKTERFRQAYITKICNQVAWADAVIDGKDWEFRTSSWEETLKDDIHSNDFVYLDPPYIGRHADYFNTWTEEVAHSLETTIKSLPCGFAYSMWLRNDYRENSHLIEAFKDFELKTYSHFYHVGSSEKLRNPMEEALIVRFVENLKSEQLNILDKLDHQMALF